MLNVPYSLVEELGYLENASASYEDVVQAGPPMDSPSFSPIKTTCKETLTTRAMDLETGQIKDPVALLCAKLGGEQTPQRGYFIEEEYKRENKHGLVHVWKSCRLAKRLSSSQKEDVYWEIGANRIVVQCILWGNYGLTQEKFLKSRAGEARTEISAMQYIANIIESHANIRNVLDVLEDERQWWIFMSVSAKEDLFTLVQKSVVFTDTTARFWFRQALEAVTLLHRAGICHRNLGLESFLLQDDKDIAILNDFEYSCRIPYAENRSQDSMRRLIRPEKICGKPLYLAPELWENVSFDGFAVDIWALGIMLFVMLTGYDPWNCACPPDAWYDFIVVQGQLEEALRLRYSGRTISASAIDLLKKILKPNPRDRLSLYELQHHPWVVGG